jgi:hypothetical protein
VGFHEPGLEPLLLDATNHQLISSSVHRGSGGRGKGRKHRHQQRRDTGRPALLQRSLDGAPGDGGQLSRALRFAGYAASKAAEWSLTVLHGQR